MTVRLLAMTSFGNKVIIVENSTTLLLTYGAVDGNTVRKVSYTESVTVVNKHGWIPCDREFISREDMRAYVSAAARTNLNLHTEPEMDELDVRIVLDQCAKAAETSPDRVARILNNLLVEPAVDVVPGARQRANSLLAGITEVQGNRGRLTS